MKNAGRTWESWKIPAEVKEILNAAPSVVMPKTRKEILDMAVGGQEIFDVAYDVEGDGTIVEATVARCKNGLAVNYTEEYMRRRDPDCLVIGDDEETDKTHFNETYKIPFDEFRLHTFGWLKKQKLSVLTIMVGGRKTGYYGLLIAPDNAGFFMGGLADLQGMVPPDEVPDDFSPRAIIYLAPPYRHSHFSGKQLVVHNRIGHIHEVFSYNLYPGPSAKKGIYGVLLHIGEQENWLTLHGSTVQVVTPYENETTILHEGASGGGKSEMLEYPHREPDGRLLLGKNIVSNDKFFITLKQACALRPVTDDMALSMPHFKDTADDKYKLCVADAEEAWFIRVNHIEKYGTDPHLEQLCVHPKEPLIFLNLDGTANSTCLIWEHIPDDDGKPCPNPRVILPRKQIPDIIDTPVSVDFRSMGIRTPSCTREIPTYGIIGMFHILPPALAWLWRLVSPRGHANPSITTTEGLSSEGVGSFWPFATGRFINHANLLLRQICETHLTRHVLFPNQHIGSWAVSFMPQWISREYLARRGVAKFKPEQLAPARSPLLGYLPELMVIEGNRIPRFFFHVNLQPEVGEEGYDQGAQILHSFFKKELKKFVSKDLDRLGRDIISCCIDNGSIEDYIKLIPMTM